MLWMECPAETPSGEQEQDPLRREDNTLCLPSDGSQTDLPEYPYPAYYSPLSIPRPCTLPSRPVLFGSRTLNADKR